MRVPSESLTRRYRYVNRSSHAYADYFIFADHLNRPIRGVFTAGSIAPNIKQVREQNRFPFIYFLAVRAASRRKASPGEVEILPQTRIKHVRRKNKTRVKRKRERERGGEERGFAVVARILRFPKKMVGRAAGCRKKVEQT